MRRTCDVLIDPEDLAVAVHGMFTQEARDEMGPLRIRKSAKQKPKTSASVATPQSPGKATSPALKIVQ
jgi:hypothetical protein